MKKASGLQSSLLYIIVVWVTYISYFVSVFCILIVIDLGNCCD